MTNYLHLLLEKWLCKLGFHKWILMARDAAVWGSNTPQYDLYICGSCKNIKAIDL